MTGLEFRRLHGDPALWDDDEYEAYFALTAIAAPAPRKRTATRRTLLSVLALAVLAVTAACTPHYPAGPDGTVTGRDRHFRKADGWHYELTVHGRQFRVTRADFRHCPKGATYPACTRR